MATSNTNVFKRVILSVATLAITTFSFPAAAQSAADIESGTLKFALSPEPPFLLTAINTTLQMGMVTSKVMEGLLYLDSDLKPQPLPRGYGVYRALSLARHYSTPNRFRFST